MMTITFEQLNISMSRVRTTPLFIFLAVFLVVLQGASTTIAADPTPSATATPEPTSVPILPGKPKLAIAGTTSSSVTLTWETVTGAESYDVYREGSGKISTTTSNSYADKNLVSGKEYTYYVTAKAGLASSQSSDKVSVTTSASTPPSAPASLKATLSGSTASLTWSSSQGENPVAKYHVYSSGTEIGTSVTTSYSVKNLQAGKTYSYTVKAEDSTGQYSVSSNAAVVEFKAEATPTPTPKASPSPQSTTSASPSPSPLYSSNGITLKKIKVGGEEFTAVPANVLQLEIGKIFTLEGTATPGTKFVLSVYSTKQSYDITAEDDGSWSHDIITENLEAGSHRLTITPSGADAEETDILQFNLIAATNAGNETTAAPVSLLQKVALALISLALIGLLISGSVLLRMKLLKKKAEKALA
jgi:hypothetical protein